MKCDKCNGLGAYSFIQEPTKEERKDSSVYPSTLSYGNGSKVTRKCEKCNGTGEVAE